MKKFAVPLLLIVLLTGCLRTTGNRAAAHLGQPALIQIQAEGYFPVLIQDKAEIKRLMNILKKIEVRPLSVEEELELVIKQGATVDAVELRFKESDGDIFKALLLKNGALLVVEGARGTENRRDVYLSAPGQKALENYVKSYLK